MGSVRDLGDARQAKARNGWCVSYVLCSECGRTWIAVHPSCDVPFECPQCGKAAGGQVSEEEFKTAQTAEHGREGRVIVASNRFKRTP
jgi:hypothetical protein